MPRKRTHEGAVRSRIVSIRITEDHHQRLSQQAKTLGMTVSGLAEQLVRKGQVRVIASSIPAPLNPALLAELKRCGNNLNQIAHALNSNLPPDQQFAVRTLTAFIEALARDDLMRRKLEAHMERTANDSPPPEARQEFQRNVQIRPARRAGEDV
jgi:transcriptional regulator of met regulon